MLSKFLGGKTLNKSINPDEAVIDQETHQIDAKHWNTLLLLSVEHNINERGINSITKRMNHKRKPQHNKTNQFLYDYIKHNQLTLTTETKKN
jgi:hypothetical protein